MKDGFEASLEALARSKRYDIALQYHDAHIAVPQSGRLLCGRYGACQTQHLFTATLHVTVIISNSGWHGFLTPVQTAVTPVDCEMRRPPNLIKDTPAPRTTATVKAADRPISTSYLDLYGLSKPPFGGAADHAGYILFGSHRRAFELLIEHMVNGAGLLLIQGEEGIGKTEILRSAATVAAESGLQTIIVSRPQGGRISLPELIALLNNDRADDTKKPQEAAEQFAQPRRKALLIDDFDLMPADCVETVWSLLQSMTGDPKDPVIVMASSVDLAPDAARPHLPEIIALVRNTIRMARLGPAEIRQYIERALWVSGGTTRRLITADAMKLIVVRSGGVPALINRLMEAALTAGYARGDAMITGKTVAAAMGPTTPRPPSSQRTGRGMVELAAQIVSIGFLITGASVFIYRGLADQRDNPRPLLAKPAPAQSSEGHASVSPPAPTLPATPQRSARPADTLSSALVAALIKRGDQSLELGDIAAARLLFQRAADAGSATAATSLGKTFDPNFAPPGGWADPARAIDLYRKATILGDPHAAELLTGLGSR